jgi:hypothetical protein
MTRRSLFARAGAALAALLCSKPKPARQYWHGRPIWTMEECRHMVFTYPPEPDFEEPCITTNSNAEFVVVNCTFESVGCETTGPVQVLRITRS